MVVCHTLPTLLTAEWWPQVILTDNSLTSVDLAVQFAHTLHAEEIEARLAHTPKTHKLFMVSDDHWSLTVDGWKMIGPVEGAADAMATFWFMGVPTLDIRPLSDSDMEVACSCIPLPNLQVGRPMSPKPWNALSYAPLSHVLVEWQSLGARVTHIPEGDTP